MDVGSFSISGRTSIVNTFLLESSFKNNYLFVVLLLIKGAFSIQNRNLQVNTVQAKDLTVLGVLGAKEDVLNDYIGRINGIKTISEEIYRNNNFYKFVLLELCSCFIYQRTKQGGMAFLHVYRILEKIAYAIPLIYVRKTTDFDKTFEQLKSFFNSMDKNSGELLFLKIALKKLLDDQEKAYKFPLKLDSSEKKWISICLSEEHKQNLLSGTSIELTIIEYIDFVVNIRNRFFHALSGKNHLSLDCSINPELVLLKCSQDFVNILCFLIGRFSEPSTLQDE
ncbi:hypothetical protein [Desulfovibrio piger]|uniref:Uncharacterized protein n=1 Tax=Desulfovibrio piger ATCC 29098 TaxID=411464 RepID=B6WWI6_9BACT|nr:hypothetical protein [Desulfovibrio piger]EEB32603.1 hypothetical protein DESPIG_02454 [Desulfovibrio piger ATCC 29098]